MRVATASEMQSIDRQAIAGLGLPGLVLMERAGLAVADVIRQHMDGRRVLVAAGPGNNGGDGLVIARELHNDGYKVNVLMAGARGRLSADCAHQLKLAKNMGVPVAFGKTPSDRALHGSIIVDALFGTGLKKSITGPLASCIDAINSSGRPVVAVDMPSGVDSDTGQAPGAAVEADITVTLGLAKRGHLLYPGAGLTGRLFVRNIGFPDDLLDTAACTALTGENMALLLPHRPAYSNKSTYGHALVLAGSRGRTGAAFMTARACLATGAGLVTIGYPEELESSFQPRATEEMTLPLKSADGALDKTAIDDVLMFLDARAGVLAAGPGLGTAEGTVSLVREIVRHCSSPMVLDADALNALQGAISHLEKARGPVIVTPHPGEMSRLSGMTVAQIEADRVNAARGFATRHGVCVILKGAPTVVASAEGEVFINTTGGPALAKAGSGDVLTGICTGLLAMGLNQLEAALLSVHLHGLAGDMASEGLSEHSVLASDIIAALPRAYRRLNKGRG